MKTKRKTDWLPLSLVKSYGYITMSEFMQDCEISGERQFRRKRQCENGTITDSREIEKIARTLVNRSANKHPRTATEYQSDAEINSLIKELTANYNQVLTNSLNAQTQNEPAESNVEPKHIISSLTLLPDSSRLFQELSLALNMKDRRSMAIELCTMISSGLIGTRKLMRKVSSPVDDSVKATTTQKDLDQVKNFLNSILTTAVYLHPDFEVGKIMSVRIRNESTEWTLLPLVNAHLGQTNHLSGFVVKEKQGLEMKGVVRIGVSQLSAEDEDRGGLLELHRCVVLITKKLGIPNLQCPPIETPADTKRFHAFAPELRSSLNSRNETRESIFGILPSDISEGLKNQLNDYFFEPAEEDGDEDGEFTLRLFQTDSQTHAHKPIRLEAKRFGKWLSDRLATLDTQEQKINAQAITNSPDWFPALQQLLKDGLEKLPKGSEDEKALHNQIASFEQEANLATSIEKKRSLWENIMKATKDVKQMADAGSAGAKLMEHIDKLGSIIPPNIGG